jgi:hypothetical protein
LIKEQHDKACDLAVGGFRFYRARVNGHLLDIRCIINKFWRLEFF